MRAEGTGQQQLQLSEREALALLSLCLTSPSEFDSIAHLAVQKLAHFCKARLAASQQERQELVTVLNRRLTELTSVYRRFGEMGLVETVMPNELVSILDRKGLVQWAGQGLKDSAGHEIHDICELAYTEDCDFILESLGTSEGSMQAVFRSIHPGHWYVLKGEEQTTQNGDSVWVVLVLDITRMIEQTGNPDFPEP